jgi:xanthine dehydrogenase accessory factor
MIGSRRKVERAFARLRADGVPEARLAELRAPVGIEIGAETPEEIAVSIAAEMVLARRGGTGRPLRDTERVFERWVARPGTGTGEGS